MDNSGKITERLTAALSFFGLAAAVALSYFVVNGDFLIESDPGLWGFISVFVAALLSAAMGVLSFIGEAPSKLIRSAQAVCWVALFRVALDLTGGVASPAYPAIYVFAAIGGAYAPAWLVGVGIAHFALLEGAQEYINGYLNWRGSLIGLAAHIGGLTAAAAVIGTLFRTERRKNVGLEEELAIYRRGQAAFNENADEFRSIREEGRREQLRESVVRLQDALHHTLNALHDILKPYTCILFTRDPKSGVMCFRDAFSESEKLSRSARIRDGEGLLGWIWRERNALRITNFDHPPENLVYYTSDEKIRSILGAPIIRGDSGVVEGLLIVDSLQEGYFTPEDERLLLLAANQVMKELETAEQRRREIHEARISHALYKVSEALNSSLDLEEVFNETMACIMKIVEADLVALALYDPQTACSKVVRAQGGIKPDDFVGKTFAHDESLVGWVTTPEQYLYYPDFGKRRVQKPVFGKNFPSLKNVGTFFCYPLVSGNEFLGSITIIFNEEEALNDFERHAVATTARMAATSIANADLHRRVAQLATMDGLTGLYNHRYFQERLAEKIEEARRHPTRHTLVLVDIDHFKKVNDTYGHPVGDVVLRAIAKLLRDSVRNVDVAARYGGEEFVLLLTHTKMDGALKLAERIRKDASRLSFKADGGSFKITISMGIAAFPDDVRSKQALVEKADQALYHAKENGRNRVVCYSDIKSETSQEPVMARS